MNLKVLQWLLKNKNTLLQVVEVAKGFRKDAPYLEQWQIVDRIARLVIPLIEADANVSKLLSFDLDGYHALENHEVSLLATGAEVQALGIDYRLLLETVIPIIIAILEALVRK
ncbi:MAG: hypothetical protein EBT15_07230 [Betaproteobacteria bacterium]|nr:hypothetical protein [Betaproteobacteria bacterium]